MEHDITLAVDIGRRTLLTAAQLALPVLAAGLIVGLFISILQAATQVQEQTLTFIPKMFVVVVVLFLIMPWLVQVLVDFSIELIGGMGMWFV
ncbi:MAG: flagellar biosynthetic protein FliQ [Planctomycetota bacterium]|jgi:flagellar biosynthetic protein FliQ